MSVNSRCQVNSTGVKLTALVSVDISFASALAASCCLRGLPNQAQIQILCCPSKLRLRRAQLRLHGCPTTHEAHALTTEPPDLHTISSWIPFPVGCFLSATPQVSSAPAQAQRGRAQGRTGRRLSATWADPSDHQLLHASFIHYSIRLGQFKILT